MPVRLNLRQRSFYLTKIAFRKLYLGSPAVFDHAILVRRAGDWHDPRLLSQHPRQGDLCAGCAVPRSYSFQQFYKTLIGLDVFRREARDTASEVARLKCSLRTETPGQKSFTERAEGHEANAKLCEHRKNLHLGFAPPQGVLALERRDRLHGMGAAYDLDAGL